MKARILLIVFGCLLVDIIQAQELQIIPAFTGYAVPAETGTEEVESILFNEKTGLQNWGNNPQQVVEYHFLLKQKGSISISALMTNPESDLEMEIAGVKKKIHLEGHTNRLYHRLGSFNIGTTGFHTLRLRCIKMKGKPFEITSFAFGGPAATGMRFNFKPRRNAASVHLFYPIPDTLKAVSFYNEITVPAGYDPIHSYYMACGFARGYFGMQVNSQQERRIIFSVWDAGDEAVDRNKVADENKVILWAKGEDVFADGFGNEGTGGHSHWIYNWRTDTTYHFLVTALPDSATSSTIYTGYFFIPELQQWKLIASFRAPRDGKYLDHLYSFNENFVGVNGQLQRRALFGNQWVRRENGDWQELTNTRFSTDATGRAGDRIDIGAGVSGKQFYLWNGGFQEPEAKYGDQFSRTACGIKPMVDLYKNADSAIQASKEKQLIFQWIKEKQIDTTGVVNGIYYQVLKEGTGRNVMVTDTVVAYYKGNLLNGNVFDGTKNDPATFPLSRLIKGWQYGLSKCKVGGKILLIIPSALAYGIRSRSAMIPPNSVLQFKIEIVGVK